MSVIQIPKKVYVGFQGRRTQDEVPLGFMVPYGEDDAGTKRQATVDKWAKQVYGDAKTFNSIIIDNAPMVGFKLGRSVRRSGWNGGGASYFRIEDPRGFELEISLENFGMIASACILERGEIMQECVWGRSGKTNILVPTNTEPYTTAVILPDDDEKVDIAAVTRGDTVRVSTGLIGTWLGTMTPIVLEGRNLNKTARKNVLRHVTDDGTVQYHTFTASVKVVKLIEKAKDQQTDAEIEAMIADDLRANPFAIVDQAYLNRQDGDHCVCLVVGARKLDIGMPVYEQVTMEQGSELSKLQQKTSATNILMEIAANGIQGFTLASFLRPGTTFYDSNYKVVETDHSIIPYCTVAPSYSYLRSTGTMNKSDVTELRVRKTTITSGTGVVFDLIV